MACSTYRTYGTQFFITPKVETQDLSPSHKNENETTKKSEDKQATMVYITADGSVDGGRSRSRNPFKLLANLITGLFNGILLFFRTISTPPERLPEVSYREWD